MKITRKKKQLVVAIGLSATENFTDGRKDSVELQGTAVLAAAVSYGWPSTAIYVVVKECIRQPIKDNRRTITDID